MSDNEEEIASTHATENIGSSSVGSEDGVMKTMKNKRKVLRGKITRSIKRIRKFIADGNQTKRRLEKEIEELRKDFHLACEVHAELYEFAEPTQVPRLDEWEDELTNDVFGVEEEIENYLRTLESASVAQPQPPIVEQQESLVMPITQENLQQPIIQEQVRVPFCYARNPPLRGRDASNSERRH